MPRIYLNNLLDKNIATETQIYTELGLEFSVPLVVPRQKNINSWPKIYLNNLSDKNIATEAQIYTELGLKKSSVPLVFPWQKILTHGKDLFKQPVE